MKMSKQAIKTQPAAVHVANVAVWYNVAMLYLVYLFVISYTCEGFFFLTTVVYTFGFFSLSCFCSKQSFSQLNIIL